MGSSEKFCLRWNDFESNISGAFRDLREDKDFFDVTLACDDEQLQAHKVILSACSPFFRTVLRRNKHEHPLLYLKGVKYVDLAYILNFMYHGEVNVAQEELNSFLAVAEDLKIKGLTQNNSPISEDAKPHIRNIPKKTEPLPPPKRPRPVPHPVPRSPPIRLLPNDDIQEVVPVKSEPASLPLEAERNFMTEVAAAEEDYSTPEREEMAPVAVADPAMEYGEEYGDYDDYQGYGDGDGSYGGNMAGDGLDANKGKQIYNL